MGPFSRKEAGCLLIFSLVCLPIAFALAGPASGVCLVLSAYSLYWLVRGDGDAGRAPRPPPTPPSQDSSLKNCLGCLIVIGAAYFIVGWLLSVFGDIHFWPFGETS